MSGAQLEGTGRLIRSLEDAAADLAQLDEAAREAGELAAGKGAADAPRQTGYLSSTVDYELVDTGFALVAAAPYAAAVHARDPWLARTVTELEDRIVTTYADEVADVVAHIKGA